MWQIDEETESYKSEGNSCPSNWSYNQFWGFFKDLDKELKEQNIAKINDCYYLSNQSGGFLCFLVNRTRQINQKREENEFSIYIQLEQDKLCFKSGPHSNKEERSKERNCISELLKNKGVNKPEKFGIGECMTSGIVSDYIKIENGKVNIKKTAEAIKDNLNILKAVTEAYKQSNK